MISFLYQIPSLNELMSQYIQISFREIGISIIDDTIRKDLFYITVNKSKKIWTETQKTLMKPLSRKLNHHIEKKYKIHIEHLKTNSNDKRLEHKKYHIGKRRVRFISLISLNNNLLI
jgi:hypothetical protein